MRRERFGGGAVAIERTVAVPGGQQANNRDAPVSPDSPSNGRASPLLFEGGADASGGGGKISDAGADGGGLTLATAPAAGVDVSQAVVASSQANLGLALADLVVPRFASRGCLWDVKVGRGGYSFRSCQFH